jgi:hypothetical protein
LKQLELSYLAYTHKAIAQVNEYLTFDEISSLNNLKAYVLIFVGSEIKVVKEIA